MYMPKLIISEALKLKKLLKLCMNVLDYLHLGVRHHI